MGRKSANAGKPEAGTTANVPLQLIVTLKFYRINTMI